MSREKLNTDIHQKIRRVRELKGMTQKDFAESLGITQGFLSELESGKYKPTKPLLLAISHLYGTSLEWLMSEQEALNDSNLMLAHDRAEEYVAQATDFVFVPQVSGKISAGGGLLPDNTVEIKIAFRRDWIQRKGDPQKMSLIRVNGDSMEPTLLSGDIVLVDHAKNFVDLHGGIYAVAIDNEIMIKRLQVVLNENKVRVISDNPKYQPFELSSAEIHVNGKVIWYGREIER